MTERNSSQDWRQQATERRFINEAELEALTGISKRTWQKHRLFGRGPRFYRLCGAVRYDLPEVLEWMARLLIGAAMLDSVRPRRFPAKAMEGRYDQ